MPRTACAPNPEDLVVDDACWQAVRGHFHGILRELYGAERRPTPKVDQPFTLPMSETTFATLGLAKEGLIKPSKSRSLFTSLAFGDTFTTDFGFSGPATRVSSPDSALSGAADAIILSSPTTAVVPSTDSTARTA